MWLFSFAGGAFAEGLWIHGASSRKSANDLHVLEFVSISGACAERNGADDQLREGKV